LFNIFKLRSIIIIILIKEQTIKKYI